ncbi:cupin domain-containing protein [Nocardioides sp. HDW12B]|uniref:cupin domain-containing protein n=1 Tax=Nocardioides sp. HDW12B TaxID=2714939 RepID=UPI00140A7A0A|nr:cupin domain-containing protein [Nocardioides sp. HDW12B]QIK68638.1 cupin domain-containing protein [Nocardioides sp. HDW12B]
MAEVRLIARDGLAAPTTPDGGSEPLQTAVATLAELGRSEIGLWDAGPGTDDDVEADEVFLVLAGRGTVTFEDGSVIDLGPGVVVRLYEGDRTRWELTERLRKLYVAA